MKNVLFSFLIIVLSMIFISITNQFALPFTYYFFSFIVSALLIVMIYRLDAKKEWIVILSIAIVCVFVRGVYPIAGNFSLIPLDDGYRDYAVAKIFLESGHSFSIFSPIGETAAEHTSGWPLLHILAISLSEVLNLDLLYVVLVLPLVFSLMIFLFIYLLLRKIVLKLNFGQKVVPLALLIYAISPDNIYTSMQFVRQNLGILFVIVLFYLSYEFTQRNIKSMQLKLCFLIFSSALVIAHSFSPFTMLLFFSLFFIMTKMGNQILDKIKLKISLLPMRSTTLTMITLFAIMMFAWWIFNSSIVLETYVPFLQWIRPAIRLANLEFAIIRWEYYGILRPDPQMYLLLLRDIALFVPAVIGFLTYLRRVVSKRILSVNDQFLIYSVTALIAILLAYEFLLGVQPLRILWFSSPFLAIFAALLYERLITNKHALWRILTFSLVVLTVFSTFLAPFARGYLPRYIYNPSISFEAVGSHNPHYLNIVPFATNYVEIEDFNYVLCDDPDLLYVVLPSESYERIRNLHGNPEMINKTGVVLFEFMHLNPSFHALPYMYREDRELFDNLESFKDQVTYKLNVVYNDGSSKIYVSRNKSPT